VVVLLLMLGRTESFWKKFPPRYLLLFIPNYIAGWYSFVELLQYGKSIYKWGVNFLLLGHSCRTSGTSYLLKHRNFFRRILSRWIKRIYIKTAERTKLKSPNFLCHPESEAGVVFSSRPVLYFTFDMANSLIFSTYDAKKSCHFLTYHRGTFPK